MKIDRRKIRRIPCLPLGARLWMWVALTAALACPLSAQEVHAFWTHTLVRLGQEPMEAKVESVPNRYGYLSFRITLRSLDGVHFRAMLSLPMPSDTQGRPLPVVVSTPGYSGFPQTLELSECLRGYAILQVFPRSQGESAEVWKIDGPDKLAWHIGNPEGAYYQGCYADVIRGIDYLMTRGDIDHTRIALYGSSQAGGIALAVGALDPRVKVVVAHVPFLCDVRAAARVPSLVKELLDKAGVNNEKSLNTLTYFDPLSLVSELKVPTLMSAGGKDTTCPEATVRAVFDRIPDQKGLIRYPDLPHAASAAFNIMGWAWIDFYLRK